MKKANQCRSFLLAIMLLLGCATPISVSAATVTTFYAKNVNVHLGETITIPIMVKNNTGFVSASLYIEYDSSVLTLIGIKDKELIDGAMHTTNFVSPYILSWENDTRTSNYTVNGTLVELSFSVSTLADPGEYSVKISSPTHGVLNCNGDEVNCSFVNGIITAVAPDCDHDWSLWKKSSASRHKRSCDLCGKVEYDSHNFDDGEIIEEPSHVAEGMIEYICEDCGATKTTKIDAEGHEFGKWSKYDAVQHKRSCSCGEVEYEDHEWDDGVTVKVPTATESGEIRYTCTVCGETRSEILSPAPDDHEHAYKVSKVVEATCTAEGYTLYRCEGCGATKRENVEAATGHSYSDRVVAPTCQAGGYTEHVCTACGHTYKSNPTEKLAHNYVDGVCTYCKGSTGDSSSGVHSYDIGIDSSEVAFFDDGSSLFVIKYKNYGKEVLSSASLVIRKDSPDGTIVKEYSLNSLASNTIQEKRFTMQAISQRTVFYISVICESDENISNNYCCLVIEPSSSVNTCAYHVIYHAKKTDENTHIAFCNECGASFSDQHWHAANTGDLCVLCDSIDTPNPPIDPDSPVAGDINGDGAVNDADAELLMKYHAGWQVTLDTSRLDVNNDMRFNNKDVTRLLQYLAGWDVEIH
ncbi:MAG: hypothetical protein IKC63_03725 [Clostridia bacterium]|nr:hypothetical protein [Clostridia bacterium]